MKTLKINIPDGFRIKSFDEKTGEVNFEPISKDIKERINNIQDIFQLNNISEEDFIKKWEGFAPYEKANALEILIVSAYNEGKLPDWEDGTTKYYPRFKMTPPWDEPFVYDIYNDWSSGLAVSSRSIFIGDHAYENMRDAISKFLPQYKDSRTL